jgi:hypothetical protein
MIKQYWKFLNWLVNKKLYYFAVFVHVIMCSLGVVFFGIIFPFLWVADRLNTVYAWLKYNFLIGINELKRGG